MNALLVLFPVTTFAALLMSGISREASILSILASVLAATLGLIIIYKMGAVTVPKNFWLMIVFVAILFISSFFAKDKTNPFSYTAIFTIGTIFWLIFYNIKDGGKILHNLILNLTLTYSVLYLITKIFTLDTVPLSKLFFMESLASRHYHVGDLWSLALILIIGKHWGKFSLKTWILLDFGFLFLVLSNARSAYLSLIVGFVYLISRKFAGGDYKKLIPTVFLTLIIGLFIFASINKTTIFSRPYFLQSIESFSKYPIGVGMGNFKQIGLEYYNKTGDPLKFSLYTHNIILEALSGVGVFAVVLIIFLYSTVKQILMEKKKNIEWGAALLAILTNFMFDTTYTIPGMIWIMFIFIGIYNSKVFESKET